MADLDEMGRSTGGGMARGYGDRKVAVISYAYFANASDGVCQHRKIIS